MARNNGSNRTFTRNRNLTANSIDNAERHNERKNESYTNPDIVPEESYRNIHFKQPKDSYARMFDQMVQDGAISTRGLKPDATHFCELIFDVNSAYFYNHGGYEFAKKFYTDAYQAAVKIVGGEQYILSAVMHADERNRAMSDALGQDVFHYHLHVVYIPVVEKEILWSKRCKDPALVGTVKETIMQVSRSKKWASQPATDALGIPLVSKSGKPVLKPSYSVLQDDFFNAMRVAGYDDVERGQQGSTEEHLTVTQFKVQQEQQRLANMQAEILATQQMIVQLDDEKAQAIEKSRTAQQQMKELAPKLKNIEQKAVHVIHDADKQLPEAGMLESGKSYREKKALPLIKHFQKLFLSLYRSYIEVKDDLAALKQKYDRDIGYWQRQEQKSQQECTRLHQEAEKYHKISRALGSEKVEQLLDVSDVISKHRHQVLIHNNEER